MALVTTKAIVISSLKYGDTSLIIRCFTEKPSLKSSLKFLRRTPWARTKVENMYLEMRKKQNSSN